MGSRQPKWSVPVMDSWIMAFRKFAKQKESRMLLYDLTRASFNETDALYEVATACGANFQERPTLVFLFWLPYSVRLTRLGGDKFCLACLLGSELTRKKASERDT